LADKQFRVRKGLYVEGVSSVAADIRPTSNLSIDLGNTTLYWGNVYASRFFGNGAGLTSISVSPAGSNTQVQFNDSGASNGSAGFVFDKVANNLTVSNSFILAVTGGSGVLNIGNSTINAVANSSSLRVSNSTLAITVGPGSVAVGANADLSATRLLVGNSTVNNNLTQTALTVANSTLTVTVGPGTVAVGANSVVEPARYFVGNSTVNAVVNQTSLTVANSTLTVSVGPAQINVGANVGVEAARVFVGNSTVNAVHNQTNITVANSTLSIVVGPADLSVGANVDVLPTGFFVGNSTVNTTITINQFLSQNSLVSTTVGLASVALGNSTVNAVVNSSSLSINGVVHAPLGTKRYRLTNSGGTAQAATATTGKSLSALQTNDTFLYKPTANNTATAPTLAIDSVSALTIKGPVGQALAANELNLTKWYELLFDGTDLIIMFGW